MKIEDGNCGWSALGALDTGLKTINWSFEKEKIYLHYFIMNQG